MSVLVSSVDLFSFLRHPSIPPSVMLSSVVSSPSRVTLYHYVPPSLSHPTSLAPYHVVPLPGACVHGTCIVFVVSACCTISVSRHGAMYD